MTPLEQLAQEEVPLRPASAPLAARAYQPYWTPAEQDQHWADLCAAVGAPANTQRPQRTTTTGSHPNTAA
ncbi:hypothetical protein [Streptomyces sp. ECR3.8]|uniref:hypothetical protein n=1 Tax=Streptomyces sp. ECR3.8 TaxID=3461009 RepID=UPI004041BA5F